MIIQRLLQTPLLKSLKHTSYLLLWSGQTLSRLGDIIYRVALAWWVLETTKSTVVMSKVLVCSFVPMLVFLLIGGVIVDRLPRLKVMIASDLLRGAIVITVAALDFNSSLEVWHVYVASVLFGIVNSFFQPAYTVIVPEILPGEALASANSLSALSKRLADILSPALGAAMIAMFGTWAAFALNGTSFIISALCLVPLMKVPLVKQVERQRATVVRDLREGIGLVLNLPWLWVTIGIASLGNITMSGPIFIALPFLVKDYLHAEVGTLGLLYSMLALGSVLGTIGMGHFQDIRRRGLIAYGAWIVGGLTLLAFGLPIGIIGVCVAAVISGAAISVFVLIWTKTLQEVVPHEMLGRVSSIDFLGSYALLPLGFVITGIVTKNIGAPMVFILGGAITAGLAALGLIRPEIRRMD